MIVTPKLLDKSHQGYDPGVAGTETGGGQDKDEQTLRTTGGSMGIWKFLRNNQKKSRHTQVMERYERVQTWPKVPEDPYELPAEPLFPRKDPQQIPQPEPTQDVVSSIRFCMTRPPEKMRVSFVTTDQTIERMLKLCNHLDTQRSDVIRASLEMALPVFENHPEMFNYFAHLARQDW